MIRDFMKKYGWRYAPGILFLVVNAYAASWTPSFLGRAIDGLSAESIDRAYVMRQIVGLVGAAILVFAARYIWRYFIIGNARYLEIFIRERLFRKMQHMPASFFDENPTGDLMAMAINDIGAVRMTAGMVVSQLLTGASTAVFSLRKMLVEIPAPLALSALIPVAVSIAGVVILGGRIRQKFGRVQQLYARISGTIQENIMGMRVLKAFHREAPAQAQVQQKSAEMRDANIDLADTSALLNPMIQILFGVSFLISLTYGSSMVLDGRITVGSLVAFNDYLLMIMAPVVSLGRIINAAARGRASYRRLNAIFAQPEVPAREYAPSPAQRAMCCAMCRLTCRSAKCWGSSAKRAAARPHWSICCSNSATLRPVPSPLTDATSPKFRRTPSARRSATSRRKNSCSKRACGKTSGSTNPWTTRPSTAPPKRPT